MSCEIWHRHMTQRVSSDPHWTVNCTAYCAAMAITDSTLAGVAISGAQVRAMSDEPIPDHGSPGLNLQQVCNVAKKFRVQLTDLTGHSWQEVHDRANGGRKVILQIDYASLGNYRCQANGDFGHAVLIAGPFRNGSALASDPLCKTAKYYPEGVLRKAAEVFAHDTGVAGIRFAVTRSIGRYDG